MTDETREEVWWEDGPIFSTTRAGSRIVSVGPDADLPRLDAVQVLMLAIAPVFCGILIALVLPASFPPLAAALGWSAWHLLWWIPLVLGAAWMLITVVPACYALLEEAFGQASLAMRGATWIVAGGTAIALLVWSWLLSGNREPFIADLAPFVGWGAAASAVVAVGALLLFLLSVSSVRRVTREILQLRAHGRHLPGEVAIVPDPSLWILARPQFRIEVRFVDGERRRTITAAMSTTAHRVPLPGSPVLVLVSPHGRTHVEPDPDRPLDFATDISRYTAPSGEGGS
ncbi:hypothetical protein [Microbacterium sp. CIAB417]|uniref:hypothetical protein n=1 Tax=Microbacterium sp. CIAB417 TaxID=2860287 RepID=UPI001FABF14E|nr:hypothetical protein [Microbacterium sp. CIAB417]